MRRTQRTSESAPEQNYVEVTTGDAPPSFEVTRSTQTDKDGNPKYGYVAKVYYETRAELLAHAVADAAVLDVAFCQQFEQAPGATPVEVVEAEVTPIKVPATNDAAAAEAFITHMNAIRCGLCSGTCVITVNGVEMACPRPHVR